jgi:hypothetical protein
VLRALVLVLSGPAASVGLGLLILPFSTSPVIRVFSVLCIVGGLGDLMPFGSHPMVSDGKRIWMLLRHPAQAER